jgi:hypothetical protein
LRLCGTVTILPATILRATNSAYVIVVLLTARRARTYPVHQSAVATVIAQVMMRALQRCGNGIERGNRSCR